MSFLSIFGGDDSKARNQYADELAREGQKYNPYISAGGRSLSDLMGRYSGMLDDPAALQNKLAAGYAPSAYATAQSKYLSDMLNNNAAATGSLGSSYSAGNLADTLHRLISGDEGRYIDRGMNQFNRGLSGEEGINRMGYNAIGNQNLLESQGGQQRMQGQIDKDKSIGSLIGQGLGLVGDFFTGGMSGAGGLIGGLGRKAGFGQQQSNPYMFYGGGQQSNSMYSDPDWMYHRYQGGQY